MGLIRTQIRLSNPTQPGLRAMDVEALVDTGALHLCLPEHVAMQLQLPTIYEREVMTADGKQHRCPYVGPVQVVFGNRGCFTGAIVLGNTVLLGAVPMEDMDLVVSPSTQTVVANPASPNIPSSIAVGLRPR